MSEGVKTLVDVMSGQTAVAKDEIVFDEAFTLHNRTVFRAACAVVQDAGLAEDITQETFIRLYNNMESITDDSMLKPWLIRVALNLAKNTIRGNSRANAREENYVQEHGESDNFTAEKEYESRETVHEVRTALRKIKEPLRSCLILKQQGLSYKEIAESLSLTETSIGTYVARGKKEFIRFYGKIGGDV
ncbi:MAG: sigma-70 family RNA polymerase sigma factor [Acidobacteria bacterium]|nr:sigma-70 family RNA polymerase sigma factor [Acidobacteriota bacterium]